tara:strand:- start:222 stop:578 length:357 start_codon:yes stop_codon:yes gene_type:complete
MSEYKKYKGSESDFQKAIATYLDFLGVLWFHSPNEIKAKPQYMVKRKAQGVKSGVPDICILEPRKDHHGLFIELKVGYNKISDNQLKWLTKLEAKGYKCFISYSFEECRDIITKYLKK